MTTSIGAYPATLAEAHAEIRALRDALLHLGGRVQTVEAWAAQSEESAHANNEAAQLRLANERQRRARMTP